MAAPDGFHSITPHIIVSDGKAAIEFYEKALGAEALGVIQTPGSDKVMHGCLQIGNSKFFLADEMPNMDMLAPEKGAIAGRFYVYVDDVDAAHKKAVDAGMTEKAAPEDMFWGDRTAVVRCPYGQSWTLATHVRDVTSEEMAEAMSAMAG